MSTPIRILLADDHPPLREGLASILNSQPEFTVVAEAGSGSEVLEIVSRESIDLFILDLRMPGGDGIQTIKELTKRDPNSRILVLTTYDNEEDVFNALEAGALGYLPKDTKRAEIIEAVVQVHAGNRYLTKAIANRLADRMVRPGLTARELDVLRFLMRGKSNKEMAAAMFISEETVKTRMKTLFQKLGVHDRTEAVAVALQRGLLRL
ncbi:MAG: DNA-binding response regulator [Verrucomicrobiales bacterium VVV1]|nr:MAG: DNA-binding response regulator [Verrucomicrobiales bacterium VVV1]